jgi:mannosyltransferase
MLLVLIVAAGALLRFAMLGHQSFWYDEVVSANIAGASLADIVTGRARDLGNPPLHALYLHAWQHLFGASDVALRASSALVSVASIPAIYSVGKRLLDDRIALCAAAIFALSPVQVYFAQETRTYALVTLLCLLATDLLLRALDGKKWAWGAYVVAVFLAMYAHYFAAFVIFAHILFVLLTAPKRLLPLGGALIGSGLLYAVWIPSLIAQMTTKGNLSRSADTWYLHAAATPLVFSVGTTLVWKGEAATKLRLLLGGLAVACFGVAALVGAWSLRPSAAKDRRAITLLGAWLGLPILAPIVVSMTMSPLYNVRYVLVASPAFYFLVAAGLVHLRPRLRTAVAAGMAITVAASLFFYFTQLWKHDWRGAAAYVQANLHEGDVLAFDADIGESAFARYAGEDPRRVRLLPPASPTSVAGAPRFVGCSSAHEPAHDVGAQLEAAPRVWFVYSDPQSGAGTYYADAFDKGWQRRGERSFRGISVRLYDDHTVR